MRQTAQPRLPAWEKKASKSLAVKICRVAAAGETPSLTGEFVGDTHRVLECTKTHPPGPRMYTNPPTRNQHQKGPICLWVVVEVTETSGELSKQHRSLSDPFPTYSTIMKQHGLPCLGEYLKLRPLPCNRHTRTKKYGPNERTDQNSRKNTTMQRRDSQPIRCRVQNIGNKDAHRNG